MGKLRTLISRIPWWVWLFLAATQVGTLIAAPFRISGLEKALQRMSNEPAEDRVREGFEKIVREERFRMASASFLAPLFLGAALWRWSRGRFDAARAAKPAGTAGGERDDGLAELLVAQNGRRA
jgi:hypothetical protein